MTGNESSVTFRVPQHNLHLFKKNEYSENGLLGIKKKQFLVWNIPKKRQNYWGQKHLNLKRKKLYYIARLPLLEAVRVDSAIEVENKRKSKITGENKVYLSLKYTFEISFRDVAVVPEEDILETLKELDIQLIHNNPDVILNEYLNKFFHLEKEAIKEYNINLCSDL
jgi:hypothetical protein